ncbi:DUF7873 family protein [Micromonospora sp. NBC_01796]|uniref:DUF7873 family protein n=1 Tax=Micromonospora sp. NBC_01796 TaxID=2975987 RepID=UPI002DD879BC|nr:hypothetical protein [Micromonospora sp. NBC_01796]WSA83066.1 hypothetical protein OIE47_21870 [Micromonospora sp. NBC_01796]
MPTPNQTKLHQVNALVKGYKPQAARALTDAHHASQKGQPLAGISRQYQPFSDDEREQLPPESTRVQINVADVLTDASRALTRLFDLQLTQDASNAIAKADVVVDGRTIIEAAPVTYLLFLEKQLIDWRTFVDKLPTLDPAEAWELDNDRGCYRSEPARTLKMRKTSRNHVRAEATEKHPAQVDVFNEDIAVGTWTTVKLSGALPAETVKGLRRRVDQLIDAVKIAREEANSVEAVDRKAGEAVFQYLLG